MIQRVRGQAICVVLCRGVGLHPASRVRWFGGRREISGADVQSPPQPAHQNSACKAELQWSAANRLPPASSKTVKHSEKTSIFTVISFISLNSGLRAAVFTVIFVLFALIHGHSR